MRGFKAFKKGMICDPTGNKPYQFAENAIFEQEEEAKICNSGFHFCENPLDVLDYYPLIDDNGDFTEFAEVEALDECLTDDNKKYCTKKIKIGAKLSLKEFINASITVTHENIKKEVEEAVKTAKATKKDAQSGGDSATLAGGDYATLAGGNDAKLAGGNSAKLAGGDYATLAGGYDAKLAGGNNAKLAGGYDAKLAGGNNAKLAGGDSATLAGGYDAKLAGGDYATLAGGDNAKLAGGYDAKLAGGNNAKLAGGDNAKLAGGENSIIVGDNGSRAKGKKGALIVLAERKWKDGKRIISAYKAAIVDGETLKEDIYYELKNGEFAEVKEQENES